MNTLHRAKQLQDRTKKFSIRVIRAFARLPKDEATRIIGRQFLRSGTSLAANYRASCRARSAADFISKISVLTEETDETLFLVRALDRSRTGKAESSWSADLGMRGIAENIFRVASYSEIQSLNL